MNQELQESLARFIERYNNGQIPWDDQLPPPEVQALVASLSPGQALDLGCGYGRTSIYLAQQGWRVDGVDFVPQAITEANKRAAASGVASQIRFHLDSVADMSFLQDVYDLAIDIGCMHALSPELQQGYRDELLRLLRPGAPYLLFARLRHAGDEMSEGFKGLDEADVLALFSAFTLQRHEFGVTQGNNYQWHSGWFWFVR